jgi:predicted HicB family RNase H-like nuclease
VTELHYTYRVEWSPEDDEWVGLVAEFPSLSWLDPDPVEAMRGVRDLVDGVVADMRETGETPPEPLTERRYSGKVFVRTSPELHRRLTIEAAEQGVSVNQWTMQKLAERPALTGPHWGPDRIPATGLYTRSVLNAIDPSHFAALNEVIAASFAMLIEAQGESSLIAALRNASIAALAEINAARQGDEHNGDEPHRDYALGGKGKG